MAQKEKGKGQMERRLSLISGIALIVGTMIGTSTINVNYGYVKSTFTSRVFFFNDFSMTFQKLFQGLESLSHPQDFLKEQVPFTFL